MMKGFFNKIQTQSPYRSEKGIHSCVSCKLYKSAESPKMQPYGNFKKKIMVIGEAPGREDDENGGLWHGPMGQFMKKSYKNFGIDLFEDCLSLSAVNCRPINKKDNNNRPPTDYEIACCRQKILSEIKARNPKVIILHGGAAISSLIEYRIKGKKDGGIIKWAGQTIPDRDFNAWLCPTFHPSYVERQKSIEAEVEVWWGRDLENFFTKIKIPFPAYKDEEKCVVIETDHIEDVLTLLNDKADPLLALDVETTGLQPYNKEVHKMVTISFCADEEKAYVIPAPKTRKQIRLLKQLLENPKIGKIAQHMKFEDKWLSVMYGINTKPWAFDTMLASHILDNRPGITGLKFQTYVRFGLLGYDDEIGPYLRSGDANTPNRIMELVNNPASFQKLLLYNGIDSLVTFRLAKIQMEELKRL